MLFFYTTKNERIYSLAGVSTDTRVIFSCFLFFRHLLEYFSFDECLMTCFEIYFRLKNSTGGYKPACVCVCVGADCFKCIYYLIYFIGGNLQELLIYHLEFL